MPKTPETFYHITRSINVDRILKDGLRPTIGTLSHYIGETVPRVYLFDSFESADTALGSWYGETIEELYGEDEPLTLLSIKRSAVQKPIPTFADDERSFEWTTNYPISRDAIKIESTEI